MRTGCNVCDGFGIMVLERAGGYITAPCIICSPTRNLFDLERERIAEELLGDLNQEKAEIAKHNQRIAGL